MAKMITIKGTFVIKGLEPDGDSIKFRPDQVELFNLLDGKVKVDKNNRVQLRIEAIDTLETHYNAFGASHQPKEMANAATDRLLALLGFTEIEWDITHTKVKEASEARGYIITRAAEKNGRPVSFVFAGETDVEDGEETKITSNSIRKSANYMLLKEGLAYPTFYEGLFFDIRSSFASAAKDARLARKGVWAKDETLNGFKLTTKQDLMDNKILMPKLFRRLIEFLKTNTDGTAEQFLEFMSKKNERVTIIKKSAPTGFDNLLAIVDHKLILILAPEEFYFDE